MKPGFCPTNMKRGRSGFQRVGQPCPTKLPSPSVVTLLDEAGCLQDCKGDFALLARQLGLTSKFPGRRRRIRSDPQEFDEMGNSALGMCPRTTVKQSRSQERFMSDRQPAITLEASKGAPLNPAADRLLRETS
jgi:hypothetical protein